ncbi:penicillin acylase family protein [Massilia sp. PAMC28688]|uniref:penicillin acylase family protein n=1 Tax=Massilia sp. PAMC28688 TaxID=2861283 RepID=UPI001C628691|nr:penicillin acylase family protein [Massilia sp. PAMC28688]QYF95463.1 penicillin acylase family protein [Massilia sp. PAMC28688]
MMRSGRWAVRAVAAAICLMGSGCGRVELAFGEAPRHSQVQADITRTSYGLAHIRADDFRGLGYGLAYAYAQDNLCMFADTLLTVRGERSRYFGPAASATEPANGEYGAAIYYVKLNNLDSDFFFKGYLDIEQLRAGYAAGSRDTQELLEGYVIGYNRYLKDHAGRYPAACNNAAWVKPITVDDMYRVLAEKALHATGEVFAQEFVNGGRSPGQALPSAPAGPANGALLQERLRRLTREQLGSNALAIGSDLSATGRGLLLGNPHYPWTSTDRFYQAHLTVPGSYDAMGVILGGIPLVVIGFNRDVAWSHTVTAAVHFTTFKLALDGRDPAGTTYLIDGVAEKMSSRQVSVDVREADGSMTARSKTFYFSRHGAVVVWPAAGLGWTASEVTVLGDPNRNNTRLMDQWLGIGRAQSVAELKSALDRTAGLPWVNTVAADRHGNTLYADASVVPHMETAKFLSDCLLFEPLLTFDGTRSACGWGSDPDTPPGIFSPARAPFAMRTDYAGNSNDSYWLNNARALLTGPAPYGYSPLYGPVNAAQSLRTRIGFVQLEEQIAQRGRLQLQDLQELAFANRIHAAELVLPDLLPHCLASSDAQVRAGCAALAGWDRRANLESRGAVLFREFWLQVANAPGKWAVPFDPRDPVHTPRALAAGLVPDMLASLKRSVQKLEMLGVPLDGPLGQYQSDTRGGVRVPIHGGIGNVDGSYNSLTMGSPLRATGYENVIWGTSYVQTVTFDHKGPVAEGMLVYGQSVDPASPHYGDQVPLFSRKQFIALPFWPEDMKADPQYKVMRIAE